MRCTVCVFLVAVILARPSLATSSSVPKLSKATKAQCRALVARHDGQDRRRVEELVRLYGPDGGRYRDGPDVFFAALASHSPRDLAEVVLLDGQGRFRVLDSGDLTLRLLAVADPAIYGPPLTDYLRGRFAQLNQEPERLMYEWEPYVVALGQRDHEAAVDVLLPILQVDAEPNSLAQTVLFRALGKVAEHDPQGMVQRRFCRLLEHAETDSWHLGVCLRALGSCGGTAGLRVLVHSLDRRPLADRALAFLAGNTSLTEDEQRKYFGGLPPQAIREQVQLSRGWKAWWHEHAADIYWHPTNHVWTTRRGEFWHMNSELAPPWQPPLPLYFVPVMAIVGIVWLLQVSGLSRLDPDRRRLRSRTHSWRNELAQFVLFLAVLSLAAAILMLPARMLLGERWGRIGVSVAVLFSGSVLSVGAATRLVRRSTRGDESQLSETRVPVAWLTGAGLLTVGTELLFREEYGLRSWFAGAGVFGLTYLAYVILLRTAARTPDHGRFFQFSLRQLMGAVTACAILFGFLSTSWHLAMLSVWLPLVAWTYLAFHAASAVPDESKRVEMLVAGEPSDGRIRTGTAALVLSILLMLISVLPCLLGAAVAAMSGFPLVSLGILIGGPMLGISLGGLTGLFCGSKLGRGFAWVFSAIIGWSGMGIFIAAGEDVSALQTTVALTLVVLGQVMGVVLVKRVRGFAERSRRHAGRAVGLSIAVGAVVVSCSLLAITRTEDQMTNFVSRAFGLVWLTATLAGVLAALSGAESRAAAPASAAVRCGGTDATETAGHDA